ncbi:hypothetical protein [Mobiluncus mulieris]|uniref:hypothetical protein n=1 Tax=Mobiluncus mulieris TaxID=2052 RepID=UPI0014702FFC|nr:hypothetical protein [Mobiluncus mulieris]NMX10973.1 hypothetical protein [Mobiluncus mulieris]
MILWLRFLFHESPSPSPACGGAFLAPQMAPHDAEEAKATGTNTEGRAHGTA